MIVFKNWQITASREPIAWQYDNLSRTLQVIGDLPEGYSWDMLVKVGTVMDIIPLSPMEGGVGVILTADQLSLSGYYQMQMRGTQGDVVRHTNVISVFIPASLSGDGQWPTVPSEFTALEARMQELAAHPAIPGDNGFWQVWDLESHAYAESEFPLPEGGGAGTAGEAGGYYAPSVDAEGNLTWTASKMDMPEALGANIMGPRGPAGKTAYQYAQEGGYTGTEEEFAAKLAEEIPVEPQYELIENIDITEGSITQIMRAGLSLDKMAVYVYSPPNDTAFSWNFEFYKASGLVGYIFLSNMTNTGERWANLVAKNENGIGIIEYTSVGSSKINQGVTMGKCPMYIDGTTPFTKFGIYITGGSAFPVGAKIQIWGISSNG